MKKRCLTCKNWFYKQPSDSKKYWKKKKYCSILCSRTLIKKGTIPWNKGLPGLKGKNSPSYKGGKNVGKNGYVRILIEGKGTYAYEHRIAMETFLGRKLVKGEIIHHKNHDRTDNRIENLELMIKNSYDSLETKNRWKNNRESFNRKLKKV
jgi:hypothetical protein